MGTLCALAFVNHGPQRPEPFADEKDDDEEEEENPKEEFSNQVYSIIQMPPGIPVATVAINGAMNAAILAIQMLSLIHILSRLKPAQS